MHKYPPLMGKKIRVSGVWAHCHSEEEENATKRNGKSLPTLRNNTCLPTIMFHIAVIFGLEAIDHFVHFAQFTNIMIGMMDWKGDVFHTAQNGREAGAW
mmetsp:Transcript_13717/g.20692  ORF Transcript_13717/g.20692 Transcript_13717/m.20692 type:complete len:99 (-) Transcript_13717:122-418(-)